MSENKENKTEGQPKGFNLLQSILTSKDKIQTNNTTLNPVTQQNNNKSTIVTDLRDMINKIKQNNFMEFKKIFNNSPPLAQGSLNLLFSTSFTEYIKNNNEEQKKIINLLLENKADPNFKFLYEYNENKKSNKMLNNFNNDYNELKNKEKIKLSLIMYCLLKGDNNLYELIKDKINYSTDSEENKNYLFYALEGINNSNIENKYNIFYDIINNKKDINLNEVNKKTGMTLLMQSVIKKNKKFVELLLEFKVDINIQNINDGNTALHYAVMSKNQEIIELLLKEPNCNLLIKNKNNKNIVEVQNNCNSDIYTALAKKFEEQQKKSKEEENKVNSSREINNSNNLNNTNYQREIIDDDIIKKNQNPIKLHELNSYIEIPFSFYNNNHNNYNNDISDIDSTKTGGTSNNSVTWGDSEEKINIKNIVNFTKTPILNISLNSEEDGDLLILDNLKNENEKLDIEFNEVEKRLANIFLENNKLISEYNKISTDIKNITTEIEGYNNSIQEKEKKNKLEVNKLKRQIINENEMMKILKAQENQLNLQNSHDKLIQNEEYLNNKFKEKIFNDNQIKKDLTKDILDFKESNKLDIKMKEPKIKLIYNSLQQLLDQNDYDYKLYIFGSHDTNLCLKSSELDLILVNKNKNKPFSTRDNTIIILQEIDELLKSVNWVNKPILINEYYIFPFITFSTDEEHGFIQVNLSINFDKHTGLSSTKLTKNFMSAYTNLEPLALVCKQIFIYANYHYNMSNILNAVPETLNSYSIVLMIIYFLQKSLSGSNNNININYINNPDNLGELLYSFFNFYCQFFYENNNFIYVKNGINDQQENEIYNYYNMYYSKTLYIIDPVNHSNNVAIRTREYEHFSTILNLIISSTRVNCDCSCHYLKNYDDKEKEEFIELGTEHCILKKMFRTAKRINSNYE